MNVEPPSTKNARLGQALRRTRQAMGIRPEDFAFFMGMTQDELTQLETGRINITDQLGNHLCRILLTLSQ